MEQKFAKHFTDLEEKLIQTYINDDIVDDYGWKSLEASAWVDSISAETEINPRKFPGVLGSLVKKNIFMTDGEVMKMTQFGIRQVADAGFEKTGINKNSGHSANQTKEREND